MPRLSRPTIKFWFGMQLSAWLRLLRRHRFAIGFAPAKLVLATLISVFYVWVNSLLAGLQRLLFARKIAATPLADDPLFIIGHWRSGTTLLHELLALDERFLWPTTYECFAPSHFLVSRWLTAVLKHVMPQRRPMDRMRVAIDKPQEDEIALLILGLGSPYEAIAFPNHRPAGQAFLDLQPLTPAQREGWKAGFRRFLQQVQLRSIRDARRAPPATRLLLKSPPHTARIRVLREMFPRARFVHLVRNPGDLYASTVKLWNALFASEGLQRLCPTTLPGGGPSIEEYVLQNLPLLYRHFPVDKANLPPGSFYELRFEDLTRHPMAEVERLYRHLGLDLGAGVRAKIERYLADVDYGADRYRHAPETEAKIAARWADYVSLYRAASRPAGANDASPTPPPAARSRANAREAGARASRG